MKKSLPCKSCGGKTKMKAGGTNKFPKVPSTAPLSASKKAPNFKIGGTKKKSLPKAQDGPPQSLRNTTSDSTRINTMNPNFSYDTSRPQIFIKPNPLPPVVSKNPQTGRGSGMGRMYMDDMSNPLPENKKGGATKDKKWIQKAVDPKHKGYCTPMSKATCTPKRKALARTFKAMAKARKGK